MNRVFWLIADSFGIGNAPDAAQFGDEGANTLRSCMQSGLLHTPTLASLGLFHIPGVSDTVTANIPIGCYGRMQERSMGMFCLIREGSAARNLEAIVKGIVENNTNTEGFGFCTDDRHIDDIIREGDIITAAGRPDDIENLR